MIPKWENCEIVKLRQEGWCEPPQIHLIAIHRVREEKMPMAATLVSSDKVAIVTGPSACGLRHYSTVALAEHGAVSVGLCSCAAVFDGVPGVRSWLYWIDGRARRSNKRAKKGVDHR